MPHAHILNLLATILESVARVLRGISGGGPLRPECRPTMNGHVALLQELDIVGAGQLNMGVPGDHDHGHVGHGVPDNVPAHNPIVAPDLPGHANLTVMVGLAMVGLAMLGLAMVGLAMLGLAMLELVLWLRPRHWSLRQSGRTKTAAFTWLRTAKAFATGPRLSLSGHRRRPSIMAYVFAPGA